MKGLKIISNKHNSRVPKDVIIYQLPGYGGWFGYWNGKWYGDWMSIKGNEASGGEIDWLIRQAQDTKEEVLKKDKSNG